MMPPNQILLDTAEEVQQFRREFFQYGFDTDYGWNFEQHVSDLITCACNNVLGEYHLEDYMYNFIELFAETGKPLNETEQYLQAMRVFHRQIMAKIKAFGAYDEKGEFPYFIERMVRSDALFLVIQEH